MSDWIYQLPILWMTGVVLVMTALVTWLIYAIVMRLAVDQRARAFKAITPGLLPPLGIVFGLLVVFLSSQVWNDSQRVAAEVSWSAHWGRRSTRVASASSSAARRSTG